jgi:hypothetical protein
MPVISETDDDAPPLTQADFNRATFRVDGQDVSREVWQAAVCGKTDKRHVSINIKLAEQVDDFKLRLVFDDGHEQIVDFRTFLLRSSHPDIRAYLDPERFASFRIEHGELVWGDYELCFPMLDLYRNTLECQASKLDAVDCMTTRCASSLNF